MQAVETGSGNGLDRLFKFKQWNTSLKRDTLAGLTTFIVMSYIIFVNPSILGFVGVPGLEKIGLPFAAVLTSTCLVAAVMTILMGLVTNRAYAIAPGMGLNAVVAFSLVATEQLSFPAAMGIVVMEGIVITILVLLGLREADLQGHPDRAQEGHRGRHRLLHPVHRPGRRRHRRQGLRHAAHDARPHRRADRGHPLRPHRHHHHAGAEVEGLDPARHRLLDDLRDHPELRLQQDLVHARHRRDPGRHLGEAGLQPPR